MSEPVDLAPPTGSVASRFVSSTTLDAARAKREEEWKATYEKLGQEAPPAPDEEYDPRSLYERLKSHKDTKQEAFEEKLKFKNQFRQLDDEELAFLDSAADEAWEEERERERQIAAELAVFKQAMASRKGEASPPAPSSSALPASTAASATITSIVPPASTSAPKPATTAAPPAKKKKNFQKSFLAAVVKKKPGAGPAISGVKRKASESTVSTGTEKAGDQGPEKKLKS